MLFLKAIIVGKVVPLSILSVAEMGEKPIIYLLCLIHFQKVAALKKQNKVPLGDKAIVTSQRTHRVVTSTLSQVLQCPVRPPFTVASFAFPLETTAKLKSTLFARQIINNETKKEFHPATAYGVHELRNNNNV